MRLLNGWLVCYRYKWHSVIRCEILLRTAVETAVIEAYQLLITGEVPTTLT